MILQVIIGLSDVILHVCTCYPDKIKNHIPVMWKSLLSLLIARSSNQLYGYGLGLHTQHGGPSTITMHHADQKTQ